MQKEIEARWTKINKEEVRTNLKKIGFELVKPEVLMKRTIFAFKDHNEKWFRIRNEGDKITLTLKEKVQDKIDGMNELEIDISDFETVVSMLSHVKELKKGCLQENKREKWLKGDIEVCIDTWPGLEPYIEIETDTEEKVYKTAEELGFKKEDAMFGNVSEVYKKELNVGLNRIKFQPNTFDNPPKRGEN